jgi:hypothetical protein
MAHMPFNPDNKRHYVGFNLPANQLSSLDAERIKLRQGRSEFLRQALSFLHLRLSERRDRHADGLARIFNLPVLFREAPAWSGLFLCPTPFCRNQHV